MASVVGTDEAPEGPRHATATADVAASPRAQPAGYVPLRSFRVGSRATISALPTEGASDSDDVGEPRPDPIAMERELADEDAELASGFDREYADPQWAGTARARLSGALDEFATEAPFRTKGVECRRSMCRAELEATSDEDPMTWGGRLVGANYGLGCATRIRFSPPDATGTPQTATLYLTDCHRAD